MSSTNPLSLRIFLSSPGDVADERGLARSVLARLNKDPSFRGRVRLEEVSWDDPDASVPLAAHLTPQEAINRVLPKPSECDLVVVVLWSRMGTPLPPEYRKPDGTPFVSGTEWEYLEAVSAAERGGGRPTVLLYRRDEEPDVGMKDPQRDEKIRQFEAVEAFFAGFRDADGSLRRSFKTYAGPSQFSDRLEADLRELIAPRLPPEPQSEAGPAEPPPSDEQRVWRGNPYRGLSAFRPEDAPIFFGRGPETDALVARLLSPEVRVLAVIGPSGSGKSSLVAAGLLPRLAAGALPGSADWEAARFTPAEAGDDPFRALGLRLAPLTGTPAAEIAERLRRDPEAIEEIAGLALEGRPSTAELLLFADQIEELFTPRVAEEHRAPFVALIDAIARSRRVRLVLTLRADYFEHCTRFKSLADRLNAGGYALAAPGTRALAEMVERPARSAGLREIDASLLDRILAETGTEPGALALMEFTLERLYEARSDDVLSARAYHALGGVAGAVEIQGERAVRDERGRVDEPALERLFRTLAEVDEMGGPVRKRALLAGLAESERALVDRLAAARLLTADRDGDGAPVVEVAHEAVLRHWGRFARWLADNRDLLLWRQRLRLLREGGDPLAGAHLAQGKDWLQRHPDALEPDEIDYIRRSLAAARRRSRIAWGLALALLAIGAAGFVWRFWEVRQELAEELERTRPIDRPEDWVEVPAGEFRMGSGDEDTEAADDERPRRLVKIGRPFRIGRYEVTTEEYNRFALATDREPAFSSGFGEGLEPERRGRLPAINVSWDDALAYAEWLSARTGKRFRLPTEAEWEYAARAGTETRRFWGDDLEHKEACRYANVFDRQNEPWLRARYGAAISWDAHECEDSYAYTAPVRQLAANGFGLHDMLGNVYEWVQDCWHDSYEGAPEDGSTPWLEEPGGDCGRRVLRGGSWLVPPQWVRSAFRYRNTTDNRDINVGFRLAQDL